MKYVYSRNAIVVIFFVVATIPTQSTVLFKNMSLMTSFIYIILQLQQRKFALKHYKTNLISPDGFLAILMQLQQRKLALKHNTTNFPKRTKVSK